MKRIIALAALALSAMTANAATFEVDKTCRIGTKDVQFKYTADSNVPDGPALVTYDGKEYNGVQQGSISAEIGYIIAVFEFEGNEVKFNLVRNDGLWLISTGTCS